MSKVVEYCKITADENGEITKWIIQGLGLYYDEALVLCSMGFILKNKLIGGVLFEGNPAKSDLWLSIYTVDKRWCCRRIIKAVFGFAFNILNVDRLSILVDADNLVSENFVIKLGFIKEGKLRSYRNGKDVYIFGMLKNECKFI